MNVYPLVRFSIELGEIVVGLNNDVEYDELGEFTDFERSLKAFCCENNYRFRFRIGEARLGGLFDYNGLSILETPLPVQIADLANGKKITISFPSTASWLKFKPLGSATYCELESWGLPIEKQQFYLDTTEVLETLISFVEKVIQMAVDSEYIKLEDAKEYLALCQEVKIKLNQQ